MTTEKTTLTIGTRGSKLARWQANHIGEALVAAHPGLTIQEEIIVTEGDRFQSGPLIEIGGKGVWVKEIEQALLDKRIDLAVHSLKDVPAHLADGLCLTVFPKRVDPRDAWLDPKGCGWPGWRRGPGWGLPAYVGRRSCGPSTQA